MKHPSLWLFLILVIYEAQSEEETQILRNLQPQAKSSRQARQISSYRPYKLDTSDYGFCKYNDVVGACLQNVDCAAERGVFMGYCGTSHLDGVCCNVVKSCGSQSSSHVVRFQNPNFPETEDEGRSCTLTLNIREGICAIRMDNDVFEMTKYVKDYCPVDALFVLGTKHIAAPLCGNMTGWSTTFEVEEFSEIQVAMTGQGVNPYRFSSVFTMIPCAQVVALRAPINAGMKNMDGKPYVTTTTTTPKPEETTTALEEEKTTEDQPTEESVTELNTTDEPAATPTTTSSFKPTQRNVDGNKTVDRNDDDITTVTPSEEKEKTSVTPSEEIEITTVTPSEEQEKTTVTPSEEKENTTVTPSSDQDVSKPTPLPVGVIIIRPTKESVITKKRAVEDKFEYANKFFDPTPNSVLSRIYDQRVGDRCQVFSEPEGDKGYAVPHPEAIHPGKELDKCWFYDEATGSYRVNEECASEGESQFENEGFRVIGGKQTKLNEYPWQVALIYKSKFFCGGALISNRHVLTASHCLFGSFSSGIHNLKVSIGDHDLLSLNDTDHVAVGVKRVIWHLHYNGDTTENDIGMLELIEPVHFSYGILPIGLPTDLNYNYAKQNATVTGWGRNSLKTKKTSSVLKEYTAPIDDIDNCVKRWEMYPSISAIRDIHLCLNVTYGTPCHGDSGGPLITCNNGPRCTLIGVVSFGFPLCRNVGLPAVFTRVTAYKRWIDINTTPLFYHFL